MNLRPYEDRLRALEEEYKRLNGLIVSGRRVSGSPTIDEENVAFLDNFNDASIFWAYSVDRTTSAKRVTESGGVLRIEVDSGTDGNWWSTVSNSPMINIGVPGYPLIIETKITKHTRNDDTAGGLHIMRMDTNATASHIFFVTQDHITSGNGLICGYAGNSWASSYGSPYDTIPIWLRIGVSGLGRCDYNNITFDFWYSTDGEVWTSFASNQFNNSWTAPAYYGLQAGLHAKNWAALNYADLEFEYFKMFRSFGPG